MVVELLAAFGVAAGVVHATAARRSLEARLARHVRLHADDRLEVVVATGAVEVEDSVHVPVVGDADRGLTVCHCRVDDVGHSGRAIEHRELGVQVEVDERVPQCVSPSCPLVRPPRPDLHACHLHRSRTASGVDLVGQRVGQSWSGTVRVGAGTLLRRRCSLARRQLAPDLLELLAGRDLLGEERRLDAVEQALEPAHELGLGDPQLGLARRVARERRRQAGELVRRSGDSAAASSCTDVS